MTHNSVNARLYPMHHRWVTNGERLQIYSNVVINVGDLLKLPNGDTVKVKDYPFIDLSEETRLKAYISKEGKKEKGVFNIIPEYIKTIKGTDIYTRFYKLEVE